MKVLVISSTPWSDDNSFGSSYNNIFAGMNDVEFANIYLSPGTPKSEIVTHYFQITEKLLIQNLLHSDVATGRRIDPLRNDASTLSESEQRGFDFLRAYRLQIFFWIRDLLWKIGRWKSKELVEFVEVFQPDIIFQPLYYSNSINRIVLFAKELAKTPMFCYVSDDVYTLKQLRFSPLYWIDRFVKRRKIRKVVSGCSILYVISDIQKRDYERIFQKTCKILTKGNDFSGMPPLKDRFGSVIRLTYTGNIGVGRWRTLAMLGRVIDKINQSGVRFELLIYTATPMSKAIRKALASNRYTKMMGAVSSSQIPEIQRGSDILVHAEGMRYREGLQVRHSFSTKIVDYLAVGRCIFAIGRMDTASIAHLANNQAALIATSEAEIEARLREVLRRPEVLNEVARKGWACGDRHHDLQRIQANLKRDLDEAVEGRSGVNKG